MKINLSNAMGREHRALLHAGCAVPALLALPAGFAFISPAAAQSVLGNNQYSTVNLSAAANPLTITAGTTLSSTAGSGVYGAGGTIWQLDNAGDIDAAGDGIQLQSAAMVSNSGVVMGADALLIYGTARLDNSGTIAGAAAAIRLQEGGSISNTGLISASGYGILTQGTLANVTNGGTILAGNDGISLNRGGAVNNSGTISAFHIGIYTGNGAGVVENSGFVTTSFGDAVSLYDGGTFTNTATGTLAGGYSGVYAAGASMLSNAGQITGTTFGVYLNGASSLTNSGTITGGLDGVIDVGAHGVLTNSGDIAGTVNGVLMGAAGTILNSGTITGGVTGVTLATRGVLLNDATGLIAGGLAGVRAAGLAQIENAGSIQGGLTLGAGSTLDNSGFISGVTAIALSGTDTLILETGSVVDGAISGGNGASQITLAGAGTLASNITGFGAGSGLTVEPGADWTAVGAWHVASIENGGTLQPGQAGQTLSVTGNFTQTSAGTLRIAVSPGATSALAVTGSADLAGHLVYMLAPGAYSPGSATFLTATGGVTGGFAGSSIVPSAQPKQPSAPQSTPQVTTQITTQITAPLLPPVAAQSNLPVAATAALPAVADPAAAPPAPAVTSAPAQTIQSTVIATPAPASTAAAASVPVTYARVALSAASPTSASLVFTRSFTVAPADADLYADNAQDMAQAADRAGAEILGHAAAPAPAPCLPAAALPAGRSTAGIAGALAAAACRLGGWAEATGTSATLADAYTSHAAGFLAGLDRAVGGTRLGVAVGYDDATLKDNEGGRANTDTLRLGVYAARNIGAFTLAGEMHDDFATTRIDRATGIGTASARPHANIVEGAIAISAPIILADLTILPAAGVRIAHLTTGAAAESAPLNSFAVTVSRTHLTSMRPYATVTLATHLVTGGTLITPSLTVGTSYEAGDDAATDSLATTNNVSTARGRPADRASGLASLGLTAARGNWSLSARYAVQGGANNAAQTVEAALQMSF